MAARSCIRGRLRLHQLCDISPVLQRVSLRGVPTSLFVDLDGGLVGLDSNDLTDEVVVTNTDLGQSAVVHPSRAVPRTSSYMAHPIMFSAMMTGLDGSVCDSSAALRCGDVPGNGVDGACMELATCPIVLYVQEQSVQAYHAPRLPTSAPASSVLSARVD